MALVLAIPAISALQSKLSRQWNCEPCSHIPGGVFGLHAFSLIKKAQREGQVAHTLREYHLRYGNTINSNVLGRNLIFTVDSENIQAMLSNHFSSFGLSTHRYAQYSPFLGEGIFTSDGQAWEQTRKLLRPQFAKDAMPSLQWFDYHFQHLMQNFASDGQPFDIQEIFFRLSLDTATGFLFGESVESLVSASQNRTGIPENSVRGKSPGFAEAFDHAQHICFQRSAMLEFYPLINPSSFRTATAVVHRFINYYVNKALQCGKEKDIEKDPDGRYHFLCALAGHTDDPKVLRDRLVNVLLASRDDVGSLLSSIFYPLARDQVAWQKLKDEVTAAVSGVGSGALRLFPPVPLNARFPLHDTTLPVGGGPDGQSPVFVRKGQVVGYSVWSLHRRPDLWGPDAESFRPERWQGRKQTVADFLPFNSGPRVCPGQQFAVVQVSHMIFRAVQHLDRVENADLGPDLGMHPRMRQTLTMSHENGVCVRVYRSSA
ncbi:Cytochrome P450 52A3 [Aspergillus wentii]|nr:Cytochrome P450 52A3 [Aspergillus wentii]